jgi:hypothetical protein
LSDQASRRRRLSSITLAPCPKVIGVPGGRAKTLRDDTLETKLTGMAKHHVARFCDVIVNLQPYIRAGEQSH